MWRHRKRADTRHECQPSIKYWFVPTLWHRKREKAMDNTKSNVNQDNMGVSEETLHTLSDALKRACMCAGRHCIIAWCDHITEDASGDATGCGTSTNMCCTGAEAMFMMCALLKRVAVLNGQPYENVLRDFGHVFRVLVMDEEKEGGIRQ